jgi:ribosomal protein S18 acetylase RimI-like enzyme
MSAFAETYTVNTTRANTTWRRLEWDSAKFGFPAARLESGWERDRLPEIVAECRRAGIRHLTARCDADDLAAVHALERARFQLLDGIQTFALELSEAAMPARGAVEVRDFLDGDRAQVLAIARESFVYDRFHADAALEPGVADRVNEDWVDNCCRGIMADAVFVAEEAGVIQGFVTCKMDAARHTGVIGMVATLGSARRRGIAREITVEALRWFYHGGAFWVEVGTQLANIPAARLYCGLGFKPVSVALTFRRTL